MDCGKSTLALQIDHNQAGRAGAVCCSPAATGRRRPQITSRIGPVPRGRSRSPTTDLRVLVRERWADGHAGRLPDRRRGAVPRRRQVEQLAELVDESHVDVYAFGLATDFRARLFPAAQRLLELADEVQRIQVEVLCWCGLPAGFNARVVDGGMVRPARRSSSPTPRRPSSPVPGPHGRSPAVRYQVLCRRHHVRGELGPTAAGPGQLALP